MFGPLRTLDRWIHRLDDCKQEFGLARCLPMAIALERLRVSRRPSLTIPARPPFLIRSGTTDLWTFDSVFRGGYYAHDGQQPKTIIDAGAHIGFASIYFARRFPEARILAVEPSPANFELLQYNVGGYPNVRAIHGALWGESGKIGLVDNSNFTDISVGPDGGEQVPAYTVPDLMRIAEIDRIDLLKMDIEGAEREVFSGNAFWLANVSTLILETHDMLREGCSRALFAALAKHDYRLRVVRPETLVIDIKIGS